MAGFLEYQDHYQPQPDYSAKVLLRKTMASDNSSNDKFMQLVFILSLALFVLSIGLIRHFAAPRTPLGIQGLVLMSFTLGFAGIILLPIDLSLDDSTNNVLYSLWLFLYGSTFVLAWLVLPLLQECASSGQFTQATQLIAGGRQLLKGYRNVILVGIVILIGISIHLHTINVFGFVMALGNTYGLLLVILLLGYGLVDIPRRLWRQSKPAQELQRVQIMATHADENLFEAVWALQDVEQAIDEIASGAESLNRMLPTDAHIGHCLDLLTKKRQEMAVLSPELQRRRTNNPNHHAQSHTAKTTDDDDDSKELSLDYLATLHRRLQHAQQDVASAQQQWNFVVQKADFYSKLIQLSSPEATTTALPPHSNSLQQELSKHWYTKFRTPTYQISSMVCAALSVLVFWGELTLSVGWKFLSPLGLALQITQSTGSYIVQTITALLPLLYMAICVYGSMFQVSFFGQYQLRGHHQSSAVALLFNAQYLVRLQFPLGYNYLYLLKLGQNDSAFSQLMKHMETVPVLGTSFGVYAPLIICALCGFTLCHGYARVWQFCGLDHEDAIFLQCDDADTRVQEGRTLLRRNQRQQSLSTGNDENDIQLTGTNNGFI